MTTETTAILTPKVSGKFIPNIAEDRCDIGCGARATVRVTLASGNHLIFCGHHMNEHKANLILKGATAFDQAENLAFELVQA